MSTCDGYQQAQFCGLLGPAQNRERPEAAGKPRVERIGVAHERRAAEIAGSRLRSLLLRFRQRPRRRRACTKRAADDPTRVAAKRSSRECSPATARRCGRSVRERSANGRRDTLRTPARPKAPCSTNHCSESSGSITSPVRSLTETACRYGSSLPKQAARAKCLDDLRTRFVAVHAGVRARIDIVAGDARVEVHDRGHRQIVAQPDLVVGRIVRRRHLYRAGAESFIDRGVGDDRNLSLARAAARERSCR